MPTIYLDNAATTALRSEVREAMAPFQTEAWGNPSSVHRRGVAAREAVDRARSQVARATGARPEQVIFTASGTEANNTALRGLSYRRDHEPGALWIGPTEHASVRACAEALEEEGFELLRGRLDREGFLDLEQLRESIGPNTRLVSQMLVSNEFGTIYPIASVAAAVQAHAPKARLHVDAIQALGKVMLSLTELGADSLSLSAHKIGGPQGVGALVLGRGVALRPLVFGGGQEHGLRSGTENLAGIVGFGRAVELATAEIAETWATLRKLRGRLVEGLGRLKSMRCLELGSEDAQQPGILSVLVPGAPAEVWLHHLDARGVVVSVGSACQANKREISPVLLAAGLDTDQARRVLRFSLSGQSTEDEIDRALKVLGEVASELASL